MDIAYGPVYEIVGFAALTPDDRLRFPKAFTDFFLVKSAVSGSLEVGRWLGVYADRKGEYPDLMLELSLDGRLFVCDMDVHKACLLAHLQKFLRVFPRNEVIPQLSLKVPFPHRFVQDPADRHSCGAFRAIPLGRCRSRYLSAVPDMHAVGLGLSLGSHGSVSRF